MKRISFLSVLLFSFFLSQAQQTKMNAVKFNPLSLLVATGNVSYERAVGKKTSVQLGGFYSGYKSSALKYEGFGLTPELRYYFAGKKEALNGVYAGPFVRYQHYKIADKIDGGSVVFSSFGGGAVIGWEKTWKSGFVLDLFAGPSYNSGVFKDGEEEDLAFGFDGFSIRTGVTIGFSF